MTSRIIRSLFTGMLAGGSMVAASTALNAQLVNDATVLGSPVLGQFTSPTAQESVTMQQGLPRISVVKTSVLNDGGDGADVNDTITYTYTVRNEGNVTLFDVTLAEVTSGPNAFTGAGTVPTPARQSGGTTINGTGSNNDLAVGGAPLIYTATYTLEQADIDAGQVDNQALASASTAQNQPVTDLSDESATAPGDDDPTSTTIPRDPRIAVVKTATVNEGGNGLNAGDTITYTYTVTNEGNVSLFDVTLAEVTSGPNAFTGTGTVPTPTRQSGGATLNATGTNNDLAVGGAALVFTASYQIQQADIDNGGVSNQALASSSDPSGQPVTDTSDESGTGPGDNDPTSTPLIAAPQIALVKTAVINDGGDGRVDANDTITYRYTVSNTGNTTLFDVSVAEITSGPNAFTGANAAPTPVRVSGGADLNGSGGLNDLAVGGGTIVFEASYAIAQADIDAQGVTNQAQASATDPGAQPVTDLSDDNSPLVGANDPTSTPITQQPAIGLVKSASVDDGGDGLGANDTITYTYTVSNLGNTTLFDVSLAEITSGVNAFTGNNAAPTPTQSGGGVDLNGSGGANDLAVGVGTITFTATYPIAQSDIDQGGVANQAQVSANDPQGQPTTDLSDETTPGVGDNDPTSTPLVGTPVVAVVKTGVLNDGGDGQIDVNDTITYTYEVSNTGNTTLFDVDVTELAASFTGSGTLPTPTYFSGGADLDGEGDAVDLAVGNATITFTAQYSLTQQDIDAGTLTNQVQATATPQVGGPVSDLSDDNSTAAGQDDPTSVTLPAQPRVALVKTSILNDGGDGADVGDTITYTYTVHNEGNVTLFDVAVTESAVTFGGSGTVPTPVYASGGGNLDGDGDAADLAVGTGTITFTATYTITQSDIDNGGVLNQATANANPPTGPPVSDLSDDNSTGVGADDPTNTTITRTPAIGLVKTSNVDLGADGRLGAGDTITYTYTISNLGNTTLLDVVLSEIGASFTGNAAVPTPTYVSGGVNVGGNAGILDLRVGPTPIVYTASYTIQQADIDQGGVNNQASVTSNDPTGAPITDLSDDATPGVGADDPTETELVGTPEIDVEKELTTVTKQFPFVYALTYTVTVENIGNVTQNNVRVTDDLAAALSPGTIVGTPATNFSGFTGGSLNASFDGATDQELLSGATTLSPGDTGTIVIDVTVNFANGYPAVGQGNTAFARSDQTPTPVESDAPSVTPLDPTDTNPTPEPNQDADNDGSPDTDESGTTDRDGDGIADAQDYDPTGYFYCEENGRILTGGVITVTGPLGAQSGVGSSNNISIVRDGADGSYQFFVTAPGTYTLSFTLPPTGLASTNRPSSGTLDLSTRLPTDPVVLGGGEVGSSGTLNDFTAPGNPFFTVFEIEAGDPTIFNNNIPLRFCGPIGVTAAKQVTAGPDTQATGDSRITYRVSTTNTGTVPVNNVTLTDDLNATFGAGNHTVLGVSLVSAPAGSGITPNGLFDGAGQTSVIAPGGALLPGEAAVFEFTVDVTPRLSTGTFPNTVVAGGASPLDGSPIPTDDAIASVELNSPNSNGGLVVSKVAAKRTARIGDVIPYTITATNPDVFPRVQVNIVDFLPVGFVYRPGSARVDGVAVEPAQSGRRLIFVNQTFAPGATIKVTFNLGVGAGATGERFVNLAWVEDPVSTRRISNIGKAVVTREIEHVFDCGEIIGKVYDDLDRNGYQDDGEPGLPGVRVASVKGLLITTDKYGRFHVPCAAIPDARIGSNFILKVDTRTLPSGYRVTSENPRVVRLTRGKITKLNFGASISRIVRVDLNTKAFRHDSVEPADALMRGVRRLVSTLNTGEPSVLRLTYHTRTYDRRLALERLRHMKKVIAEHWRRTAGDLPLTIETKIVGGR